MSSKKIKTSLYIEEDVHEEIKEYVRQSNEFNSLSEFVNYLFKTHVENDPLVTDSNLQKIKKDLASTQRNSMILLQIISNLANKEQVIAKDMYEDIYQYKSAVEIIDEHFNNKKMNRYKKNSTEVEQTNHRFKIDPYDF